jgi:hypothetical protein
MSLWQHTNIGAELYADYQRGGIVDAKFDYFSVNALSRLKALTFGSWLTFESFNFFKKQTRNFCKC